MGAAHTKEYSTLGPRLKRAGSNRSVTQGTSVEMTSGDSSDDTQCRAMQSLAKTTSRPHHSGKAPGPKSPLIGDRDHNNQRATIYRPIERAVMELEYCRQTLKHAVKHCLEVDFSSVSCAISCILNSLRPLHTWEIDTAVDLFVEYADTSRAARNDEVPSGNAWLQRCASLLTVDDCGLVRFASHLMPHFLRQFRIRGIDVTHRTIATACLIQVEMDGVFQISSMAASATSLSADSEPAFSDYASMYWRDHCRNAEESCQKVNSAPLSPQTPPHATTCPNKLRVLGSVASTDLELSEFADLKINKTDSDCDEEEWDMLDEYR